MFRKALLALCVALPAAAQAEWREAVSKNFIVYSEGSEERLRQTVAKLEKYDFALRWAAKVKPTPHPVKIKIYLMRDTAAVANTLPLGGGGGIAGYYTVSARGPIAVSTRSDTEGEDGLAAQEVLFHELAHHFMFQHFPATYPAWYSEGFADYYGTARILDKDVIEVGHGVRNRYLSFEGNRWMPLSKMLSARHYSDVGEIDLLYAQGWLLVHYLAYNKERAGQLEKYLTAINAGVPYQKAMDDAFGPGAKQLNSELRDYSARKRIMALRIPFKPIDVGPIAIRTLSLAEDALIEHDIALGGGIPVRVAADFARKVRSAAARFPKDPYALRILTEAERAAGNKAAALEAVERWLAVKPGDGLALMHKAELQIEALRAAKSSDKSAWEAARKLILAANKAAPGNPQILAAYYNSFISEGVLPPPGAQNALVRAFELVPQDDMLRQQVAADFEHRGMIAEAIAVIKPAAFSLHGADSDPKKKKKQDELLEKYRLAGDGRTETAREMLERLEKKLAETKGAAGGGNAASQLEGN
jgi:hypothetical protein